MTLNVGYSRPVEMAMPEIAMPETATVRMVIARTDTAQNSTSRSNIVKTNTSRSNTVKTNMVKLDTTRMSLVVKTMTDTTNMAGTALAKVAIETIGRGVLKPVIEVTFNSRATTDSLRMLGKRMMLAKGVGDRKVKNVAERNVAQKMIGFRPLFNLLR